MQSHPAQADCISEGSGSSNILCALSSSTSYYTEKTRGLYPMHVSLESFPIIALWEAIKKMFKGHTERLLRGHLSRIFEMFSKAS